MGLAPVDPARGKDDMRRVTTLLCALFAAASLAAQSTPAPLASPVIGVGNFSHIVENLDKSLAFYKDLLLELMESAG